MHRLNVKPLPFVHKRSIVGTLAFAAILCACSETSSSGGPTSPEAPAAQPPMSTVGAIAGFVLDESRDCVIGARIEMVDGPGAGTAFVQTYCHFWGYESDNGYSFVNLPVGSRITIRASAKGYKASEITAIAANPYQYTTDIVLSRE